jgi:SAM-dependent methyltransferase
VEVRVGDVDEGHFDTAGLFDADYLYFYEDILPDSRSDTDAEFITRLLEIEPGMRVLDLACGHGRIANRLAARGCVVTGLDATALFLDLARRDAAARGVTVDYVAGDMRDLPWRDRFDRVVLWFTAFGYFDDDGNRRVLAEMAKALRPGGRLVIDMNNHDWLVRTLRPDRVFQRGGDLMIDRSELHPLSGRIHTERILVRDGRIRRTSFFVRLFTYTELRDWLLAAGLGDVRGHDEGGGPLSTMSHRLIVTARRPL